MKYKLYSRHSSWFYIILLALFLITLYMGWIYLDRSIRFQRLESEGLAIPATITNLRVSQDTNPDSGYQNVYSVDYNFQAVINGNQTTLYAGQEIPQSLFATLQVGQEIQVLYDASDPDNVTIKSLNQPPKITILVFALVGAAVFFLVLVFSGKF